MDIRVTCEYDVEKWDKLCRLFPNSTLFHSWNWLKYVEKESNIRILGKKVKSKLYTVIVYDGDTPIGVFPFFFFEHPLIKIISSPPMNTIDTLYLGPLIMDNKFKKSQTKQRKYYELANSIHQFIINELKPNIILIKTSPGFLDFRPFRWLGYTISPFFTQSVNLVQGEENIWRRYSNVIRNNIRRAEKNGIKVREGEKVEYNWLLSKMEKHKRLNISNVFADSVFETFFPDNMRIFIAEKDGEYLSGLIILLYYNRIVAWLGTPKTDYMGISPNALIYWETMRWGIRNEYKEYEILGAEELSLFPWKRKFGTELIQFYLMRWRSKKADSILKIIEAFKAVI